MNAFLMKNKLSSAEVRNALGETAISKNGGKPLGGNCNGGKRSFSA